MSEPRVSIPRIRRVRFKDGRAPLEILHRPGAPMPNEVRPLYVGEPNLNRALIEAAREISADFGPAMDGFMLIAWDRTGYVNRASRNLGNLTGSMAAVRILIDDTLSRDTTNELIRHALGAPKEPLSS